VLARVLVQILVQILVQSLPCESFSRGASGSSCALMVPGHVHAHPHDPAHSHVTLHTSREHYLPGHLLTVTLRSSRDFMGFLLQARTVERPGPASQSEIPVQSQVLVGPKGVGPGGMGGVLVGGAWTLTPPGTHAIRCVSDSDTVTHSDKQLKRNLSFVWRAPDKPAGDVRFYITVVQSYFVYWPGITSPVLHDGSRSRWRGNSKMPGCNSTATLGFQHKETTIVSEVTTQTSYSPTNSQHKQTDQTRNAADFNTTTDLQSTFSTLAAESPTDVTPLARGTTPNHAFPDTSATPATPVKDYTIVKATNSPSSYPKMATSMKDSTIASKTSSNINLTADFVPETYDKRSTGFSTTSSTSKLANLSSTSVPTNTTQKTSEIPTTNQGRILSLSHISRFGRPPKPPTTDPFPQDDNANIADVSDTNEHLTGPFAENSASINAIITHQKPALEGTNALIRETFSRTTRFKSNSPKNLSHFSTVAANLNQKPSLDLITPTSRSHEELSSPRPGISTTSEPIYMTKLYNKLAKGENTERPTRSDVQSSAKPESVISTSPFQMHPSISNTPTSYAPSSTVGRTIGPSQSHVRSLFYTLNTGANLVSKDETPPNAAATFFAVKPYESYTTPKTTPPSKSPKFQPSAARQSLVNHIITTFAPTLAQKTLTDVALTNHNGKPNPAIYRISQNTNQNSKPKVEVKAKLPPNLHPDRGGKYPDIVPRHSAWELGMLLGCAAGLGMVLVVGVRYVYRKACGKRTQVTLNDREREYSRGERGLIHIQECGDLVRVRRIRENSFVLLAEYDILATPGD
ncbi:hypothetical protein NQD34_013360, partial [Periophthalmus magnuspinnatus]